MVILNTGGYAVPFDIKLTYSDGSTESIHETPIIWQQNQKQVSVPVKTNKTLQTVVLDGGIFVDANESNNRWQLK